MAVPTQAIDHIIPFRGRDDPLRLDRANVRPLCRSCHTRKTQRLDHRVRAYFERLAGDGMAYERARDATIERFRWERGGEV